MVDLDGERIPHPALAHGPRLHDLFDELGGVRGWRERRQLDGAVGRVPVDETYAPLLAGRGEERVPVARPVVQHDAREVSLEARVRGDGVEPLVRVLAAQVEGPRQLPLVARVHHGREGAVRGGKTAWACCDCGMVVGRSFTRNFCYVGWCRAMAISSAFETVVCWISHVDAGMGSGMGISGASRKLTRCLGGGYIDCR